MAVTVFTVFEVTSVDSFATALPIASISRPSSPIEASAVTTPTCWFGPAPPNPPGPPGRPPPGPPACAPIGGLPSGPGAADPPLFEQPATAPSTHSTGNVSHADTCARARPDEAGVASTATGESGS